MGRRLRGSKFLERWLATTILYVGNSVYILFFACCIGTRAQFISQGAILCTYTISYNEIISLSYLLFIFAKIIVTHLWKTLHGRARWLQHLIARTLNQKQTEWNAWLVQLSKPQHLKASHVQVLGHVPHDQWALSLAWFERNPCIQTDLVTPVTCVDQRLWMSG
jgi:hypothetical protein